MSSMSDPIAYLQPVVNVAVQRIFGDGASLVVFPMGSRVYGAASENSDWDFYAVLNADRIPQKRILQACVRQLLVDQCHTTWSDSSIAFGKDTVEWKSKKPKQKVSIYIGKQSDITGAIQATEFLKQFFVCHPEVKTAAMCVAEHLRTHKHMAVGGVVGDTLKSASFFFFCAGLSKMRCNNCCTEAGMAKALAEFRAWQTAIVVKTSSVVNIADSGVAVRALDEALELTPRNANKWPSHALLVLQCVDGQISNSARRVTEPRLAAIQQICYQYSVARSCEAFVPHCPPVPSVDSHFPNFEDHAETHYRHMVYDTVHGMWIPAVANVWRNAEARQQNIDVLVILTGDANDRHFPCGSYDFVAAVGWGSDHTTNPDWLPAYLLRLADAASRYEGGLGSIDVVGLSRGHQALMSCFGSRYRHELQHRFRHFAAGGGCIWQRQDSNSTETPMVLQGLREASQQRNSPILRLLVLSRMDGTVLWGGDVKGTTSARIDYLPHVVQIKDCVADGGLVVLNTASHTATCAYALECMQGIQRQGVLPGLSVDEVVAPTDFLSALHALASGDIAIERDPVQRPQRTPFLFRNRCQHKSRVPPPTATDFGNRIVDQLTRFKAIEVDAEPGAGKSTKVPTELFAALMNSHPREAHGMAIIMDLKDAQNALFDHIRTEQPLIAPWVAIWNGDQRPPQYPRFESYMVMATPGSFLLRMMRAASVADVQYKIYDELHDAGSEMLYLLSWDLHMMRQGAPLRLGLMSATKETPIFRAAKEAVENTVGGITRASMRVHLEDTP